MPPLLHHCSLVGLFMIVHAFRAHSFVQYRITKRSYRASASLLLLSIKDNDGIPKPLVDQKNPYLQALHDRLEDQYVDSRQLHAAALQFMKDPSMGYDPAFGKSAIRAYLSYWKRHAADNHVNDDEEDMTGSALDPRMLSVASSCARQVKFLRNRHLSREAEWVRHTDTTTTEQRHVYPLILLLDNVRSAYNVGSLFRTADACGCTQVITTGITPHPHGGGSEKLSKSALGAERYVPSLHFTAIQEAIDHLRNERPGWKLMGMETTDKSTTYTDVDYPQQGVVLILGNEVTGVDSEIMHLLDGMVEIPMFGAKNSLNIAACAPVVLYEVLRQWRALPSDKQQPP